MRDNSFGSLLRQTIGGPFPQSLACYVKEKFVYRTTGRETGGHTSTVLELEDSSVAHSTVQCLQYYFFDFAWPLFENVRSSQDLNSFSLR